MTCRDSNLPNGISPKQRFNRQTALPLRFLELENRLAPATLTVNSLLDTEVPDNVLTLREAIATVSSGKTNNLSATEKLQVSGALGTNDAIILPGTGGTITVNRPYDLHRSVTIAPAAGSITITGGGTTRLLNPFFAPSGAVFTFSNLNLIGGGDFDGGAVLGGDETLNFVDCTISSNTTTGGNGGAISVYAGGRLNLTRATISGNAASNGGAIHIGPGGRLTITDSILLNNNASNDGGGIFFAGSTAEFTVRNSTLTQNTATNRGGGVMLRSFLGSAVFQNSTIVGNKAINFTGGGIDRFSTENGIIELESTIVSGNVAVTGPDISSVTGVKATNSAIGITTGFTFATNTNNVLNQNLLLGPLQNNGGPTLTIQPAGTSPVKNKGSNPANLVNDARGAGFPRQLGTGIDIGAVETASVPETFTVTNANDAGPGSLRQAILNANANPAADTINFGSLFNTPQTITLATGEIAITGAVTIAAPAARATIDAGGLSRIFNTSGAPAAAAINFNNLTLTGGRASDGGAAFVSDEFVTFTDCRFTGNSATANGGALRVNIAGALTLTRSTVSGNTSTDFGGGIFLGRDSSLTILDSLITSNSVARNGGGIYVSASLGANAVTLRNTTISANTAQFNGGGLVLRDFVGEALIQNSTIVNNTARQFAGGGILRIGQGAGFLSLQSSIVSGNAATTGPEIYSVFSNFSGSSNVQVNAAYSAIGTTANFALGTNKNNIFGQDLLLGPLQNNGGPTFTHQPASGSPVRNRGSNPAGLSFDARGADFPRSAAGGTDIGAVEALPGPIDFVVINSNDSGPGSLRQAILDANANPFVDTISFGSLFNTPQTINLTSGEMSIAGSVTITGPGVRTTLNAGGASRIFDTGASAFGVVIAMSNLIFTGGNAFRGGAVSIAHETVSFTDCTFTNNISTGSGGAIAAQSNAALTLTRCSISSNTATDFGGGIYLNIGGSLTILDSTLSGNTCSRSGGAVYFVGDVGAAGLTIRNTTVSGNTAKFNGGGLVFRDMTGDALIQNSTIVANTASQFNGGGIFRNGQGSGTVVLQSTIVSDNIAASAPDILSVFSSLGGNFNVAVNASESAIGNATTFVFGTDTNNLIGQNLLLGPLQNNGGPTLTHRPAAGSPVKDKGSNPANLANDARGPGYPRLAGTGVDIGAVEAANGPMTFFVTTDAADGPGSLRQAVLAANANAETPDTIIIAPMFTMNPAINLQGSEIPITDSVTITGPDNPYNRVTLNAGGLSRIFNTTAAAKTDSITFNRLAFTGGKSANGGALLIGDETVTFNDCVLTGNTSSGGGGAVNLQGAGTLNLTRTTITGNSAATFGGGVFFDYSGGATITDSTIDNNQSFNGGGLYFTGTVNSNGLTFRNVTVSGNTASFNGGGLVFRDMTGDALIENSTIVGNTATNAQGGGIFRNATGLGTVNLLNAIVSGNIAPNTPDISSNTAIDATNSAIGSPAGFDFATNENTIIGQNLRLGTLRDNGGPVQTIAPQAGSPIMNAGSAVATADARGLPVNGVRDLGAFEVQPITVLPATLPSGKVDEAYSQTLSATATTLPSATTFTYAVTAGTLPSGITLVGGTLSGTPTVPSQSPITITVTASTGDSVAKAYSFNILADAPPTLSALMNVRSSGAAVVQTFTIGDDFTPAAGLLLSAKSSNPALLPIGNIVLGGSGGLRTVSVTPAPGKLGTAAVTVTVADGTGGETSSTFTLTVQHRLEKEFSIGSDKGTTAAVSLRNPDNSVRYSLMPFGANFTGGIRTAAGDVTGDGVADLIAASGFGMKGTVKVFDGVTQAPIPLPETVAGGGMPFGDTFTRGILVATGDLNADGLSDLIITAEAGGGARVRVFQSTGAGFVQRSDFIALIDGLGNPDSVRFRGGSRAAVSDINGDGVNDLIWAAGAGGGPRIATFDGKRIDNSNNFNSFKLTGDFFALGDTSLRDGCFLAGGDFNGDGFGDIAFGGGTGAPPIVVIQSGAELLANITASKGSAAALQSKAFFVNSVLGVNSRQGIRVALKDVNADNIADLIIGSAPGAGSRVVAYSGKNLSGSNTGAALFDITAFPGFTGGVFVG